MTITRAGSGFFGSANHSASLRTALAFRRIGGQTEIPSRRGDRRQSSRSGKISRMAEIAVKQHMHTGGGRDVALRRLPQAADPHFQQSILAGAVRIVSVFAGIRQSVIGRRSEPERARQQLCGGS